MPLHPGQMIISGDSHFVEPPDLFTTGLPVSLRDRAPRTFKGTLPNGRVGEFFVGENIEPSTVAGVMAAGKTNYDDATREGYDGAPKSVWDPAERLKEQDVDTVAAEVLYPSWGMFLFSIDDDTLRRACFHVFNKWAGEYCSYAPNRLKGIGICDLADIDEAIAELHHVADAGLSGVLISGSPETERPYSLPDYDPFWATAQELGLPLSMHILTGRKGKGGIVHSTGKGNPAPLVNYVTTVVSELQGSLAHIIAGGVFDRFPNLRLVLAEADVGWQPHFVYRMDHFLGDKGAGRELELEHTTREYFARNIYSTAQFESGNLRFAAEQLGADHFMWSSDYPHWDCPYPESRALVEEIFSTFSDDDVRAILVDTPSKVYGIDVGALSVPAGV